DADLRRPATRCSRSRGRPVHRHSPRHRGRGARIAADRRCLPGRRRRRPAGSAGEELRYRGVTPGLAFRLSLRRDATPERPRGPLNHANPAGNSRSSSRRGTLRCAGEKNCHIRRVSPVVTLTPPSGGGNMTARTGKTDRLACGDTVSSAPALCRALMILTGLALSGVPAIASAQSKVAFDIEAGPAVHALNRYARQARVQVGFSMDAVDHVRTNAV